MKDIENKQLNVGDYFFLAAKASISHILKLGLVLEVFDDYLYYCCIENDWRGFKISSKKLKLKFSDLNTYQIDANSLPDEIKNSFHNNPIIREEPNDFLNQNLTIGSNYLIAKHKQNQSRLIKAKLIELVNGYAYFEDSFGEVSRTKQFNRIVKI